MEISKKIAHAYIRESVLVHDILGGIFFGRLKNADSEKITILYTDGVGKRKRIIPWEKIKKLTESQISKKKAKRLSRYL